MDGREWLLADHRELRGFFERGVLRGLSPDQLRERPGEVGNSIAWCVWHLARAEDVVINTILRQEPQLLVREDWGPRMRVADLRVGTGFEAAEVEALSRAIDLEALDAYWQAVRQATAAWLPGVPPAELDAVLDVRTRLDAIAPIAPPAAREGLIRFWSNRPAAFLVRFPLIHHGYLHIGEMLAIRGRLGVKGF
ncbi:MAG: DinB family protein [Candidatus Rokuibacteriota bacterium]